MLFISKQSRAPSSDFFSADLMRFKRSWRNRSMLTRSSQSTAIRPKVLRTLTAPFRSEQGADLRFFQRRLDAFQAILAQPFDVDPFFPIDGHQAEGLEAHDCSF